MKHINLVGVEMEGGWGSYGLGISPFADGTTLVDDQSLRELNSPHIGEAVSPALPVENVTKWIIDHHPHEINNWCGLHVHVSFKTIAQYLLVASRRFEEYFLNHLREWAEGQGLKTSHPFWARWRGENQYCRKEFMATRQMRRAEKHPHNEGAHPLFQRHERRTQLNYPYRIHRTVECRLLPMFDNPIISASATMATVEGFSKWLELNKDWVPPKFDKAIRFFPNEGKEMVSTYEISVPASNEVVKGEKESVN